MAQKWYAFKNTPDKSGEVELYLYDEIGSFGVRSKEFVAELKEYKDKHVHLRINSLGGEIGEGTSIYNALIRHPGGVTVHIDSLAASMASVIAMAGNPVYMAENAILMIHNPWTLASGEATDLRKQADLLDMMKSNLVRAYQKKTGMEETVIARLMDEETWLDATEAAALGFIDAIEDGIPAAASAKEMRARFDTFAKRMNVIKDSVVAEADISAPAVEPVVEETPVVVEAEVVPAVEPEPAAEVEAPAAEEAPKAAISADEFVAKISALAAEKAEAVARASRAEAELAKVQEAFAALEKAAGVAPAAVIPTVAPAEEQVAAMTREQFETLSHADRAEFFHRGGKLTD
jgi:ATP-dependent protease ClpP protease subunit